MASFDENGLKVDRIADIYAGIQNSLRTSFGDAIDLDERQPIGIISAIFSERIGQLHELLESVYLASFPSQAFGIYLDYLCALNGVSRRPATSSVVDVTFTRSNEPSDGNVTIPAGTSVKDSTGSAITWNTNTETFIASGESTVTVRATCSETGTNSAAPNTLTVMTTVPSDVASVTNLESANIGSEEESDSELRARREQSLGKTATPTQVGLTSALLNMPEIASATVVVNDRQIEDSDGRPPHCFEAYVSPITGQSLGQETEILFDSEIVENDVITINIDGVQIGQTTAVADVATTLDNICVILASSELVLIARPTSNTAIEVTSATSDSYVIDITSANGVGVTESVVSAPSGLINKVAQTLWDSKAVGIKTHGDITGEAIDVDGYPRPVNFSTISPVPVYVKYTLTVNSMDSYEAETDDKIKNAVAAYAQINYTAGVDVLNYELLCIASDLGLSSQGVIGLQVETSLDNIAFTTDNVNIGVEEFALIEAQNVTVNVSE